MPVRSLNSAVLRWPDARTVDRAVRAWAYETAASHPAIRQVGYMGSYARGDWGVGSDVDLVIVVDGEPGPFPLSSLDIDTRKLPVPADVIVYGTAEFERLMSGKSRMRDELATTAVWCWPLPEAPARS